MKGVSEVIAIILILMITISLAGLAYMFMSTTMSDVTASAGSSVDTTTSSMTTSFVIESISQGKVYVRNTGQNALTGLSVYVDDQAVNASIPTSIAPGAVGVINVTTLIFENDAIRVTSANGVSASKPSSEWYGAVAYWKFDEGSGNYTYDSSTYGNTGNLTNGPAWTSGKFGSGLQFDGATNYVNAGNSSSLNAPSELTMSLWIYLNSVDTSQSIINKNNNYWVYFVNSSTDYLGFWVYNATGSQKFISSLIITDTSRWYHVVFGFNCNTGKVFKSLNGEYTESALSDTGMITNAISVLIGRGWGGSSNQYFNGTIDEVAIWNRALSSQEILKLYNKAS